MRKVFITLFALFFAFVPTAQATQIDPHILPDFYDSKVPTNLTPSLTRAIKDFPTPYFDGCHTQQNMPFNSNNCLYGVKNSKTTVVLFGDSHALSWFPAIEKLALSKKWKFYSLTMSSCWPADITAWNNTTNEVMDNCSIWRKNTLAKIKTLKPKYVFVAGTLGFSTVDSNLNVLKGDDRLHVWQDGMNRTLSKLSSASQKVFYLADYPVSVIDPVNCLRTAKKVSSCVNPMSNALNDNWLQTESDMAEANKAIFIDGTEWICQTDPCSPISDNLMIYRDAGHLTATFAKTLYAPLYAFIKPFLM